MTLIKPSYVKLGDYIVGDDDGTVATIVERLQGWGTPATTLAPQQRARAHGTYSGESFLQGRPLALSGALASANPLALSYALDDLIAACGDEDDGTTLAVSEWGRLRRMFVRRIGELVPDWLGTEAVRFTVQFWADDPLKYGMDDLVGTTALASTTGGATFPFVFPLQFTGNSASGQVSIRNEGNATSPIVVRFTGPVVGPKVTHVETGAFWAANGAVIPDGVYWDVDMSDGQVLANGQESRSGYVTTRGRMSARPGDNTYAFAADVYDAAARMTVTTRSAWR